MVVPTGEFEVSEQSGNRDPDVFLFVLFAGSSPSQEGHVVLHRWLLFVSEATLSGLLSLSPRFLPSWWGPVSHSSLYPQHGIWHTADTANISVDCVGSERRCERILGIKTGI